MAEHTCNPSVGAETVHKGTVCICTNICAFAYVYSGSAFLDLSHFENKTL